MRHLRWIVPLVVGTGVGAAGWIAQLRLAERPGDVGAPEVLLPTLLMLTALFGGPVVGVALAVRQGGRMLLERRRARAAERRAVSPAFQPLDGPAPSPTIHDTAPATPEPADPPQASAPRHPSIFDA
ncbi:hypothetical protein [Desertihabitans aurantiacus]|uniref:hypothetical protein n=1 Tax=Desertihabitans aurantiacus TaxID=2282477 RepID=UPI000DF7804C|nr:hypothetical protein [Desertihabitans aurantiacus]